MNDNKKIEVKEVMLDGKVVRKARCPGCGTWGVIDDDQFHGRVSILCECGFHETMNLAELWIAYKNKEVTLPEFTRLTIKSDGTSRNTQVLTEDGKVLEGVTYVVINIGLDDEVSAVIRIIQPRLELNNVKAEILGR